MRAMFAAFSHGARYTGVTPSGHLVDGGAVVRFTELSVDLVDHPRARMPHEPGHRKQAHVGLNQPTRERAAKVVRRHPRHPGTLARGREIASHASPPLNDGPGAGIEGFEPRSQLRRNRDRAGLGLALRQADDSVPQIDVLPIGATRARLAERS